MAVPTLITDLSTTAASNAPAGSDSVFPDLDNFIRQYGAFIAQLNATDALKAPIASPTFTGNAGFGVTPQTWGTNFRALQFGAVGALAYDNNFGQVYLGSNFYMAGSGVGTPTYISSNSAARLDVTQSGFSFKLASSGSAGAPITWTNVASIDATDGPQRATDATTSNGLVRKSQMDAAVSGVATPSGAVMAFARTTAPTGWLKCDGSAVSRSTYAALFAEVGTAFGAGDGSSTFNLPDLRGEFIRGFDDGRGIDAGRAFASVQSSDNKAHDHMVFADADSGGNYTTGTNYAGRWVPGNDNNMRTNQIGVNTPPSIGLTSQSGGSESRPRNVALLYCIKT